MAAGPGCGEEARAERRRREGRLRKGLPLRAEPSSRAAAAQQWQADIIGEVRRDEARPGLA